MNRPVSFAIHVAPLFSESQQECMRTKFDLKSHADVSKWANKIYQRLLDKSMPADETGPWPDEWIALFKRWMDEGHAP